MRALLLILALPAVLAAQDARGRIAGRVTDTTGAVVPGVAVHATNVETNVRISATTNGEGGYDLPYLLPGVYTLSAEFSGFKKYERAGLEVRVDDLLTVDISLQPGDLAETITVTAETPILEEHASLGQVVDSKRITELPLSGGNAFTLATLTAGVTDFAVPNHPSLAPAVEVVSNFSVSGSGVRNTEFTIDGAPSMWGRNASFVPPADMIGEFKVETARFDAAGRSPGGSVNVSMRSGANKLHGTLYERHNNNKLMGIDGFQRAFLNDPATGPINDEKRASVQPHHVINHFSATLSGPVELPRIYSGRNRTFFIYGFEGLTRPSQERGDYTHNVPTLKQRDGDFSDLLAINGSYQIYDPATTVPSGANRLSRQPLAGNIIPRSRMDPMAVNFLQYWPAPNLPGTIDFHDNYWGVLSSYNEYFSHMGRVDHNVGRHRIFGRYNQSHQLFDSTHTLPSIATGQVRHRYSKGFGLDDVFLVTPSVMLNVRYNVSRFIQSYTPTGQGFDLAAAGFAPSLVNSIDPQGVTFPRINVNQLELLGNQFPTAEYTNYHTFGADVSKAQGKHNLRMGAEFRLYREHNNDFDFATPLIEFNTNWTRGPQDNSAAALNGQGLASFLFGLPTGGSIQVNDSFAQQSTYTALFIQDEFRATPRLTLNLGLRYEYETPPTERYNRSTAGFDFTTPNPIEAQARANYARSPIPEIAPENFRATGGLMFAGANGQPRRLWNAGHRNFAPRFGLAFRMPYGMVMRAGYGLYYITQGVDRIDVNQAGYSQETALVPSLDTGQTFIASFANPFPRGFAQPLGAAGGLSTNVGLPVDFFKADRPQGYTQRWSFSLQKQLPQRWVLETAYVGSRGAKLDVWRQFNAIPRQYLSTLPTRDNTVNNFLTAQVANPFYPMLPGTDLAGERVQRQRLLRPYPQFGDIRAQDQVGYSWYHSLQARAQRRLRDGLTMQVNYTWSKFMEAQSFLDPTDPMPEERISDLDRPHRLVINGMYEMPFGRGRKWGSAWRGVTGAVAGGWQVSAIYQATSGPALGFGNVLYYGRVEDIVLPASERSTERWFNTDLFEKTSGRQLVQNIRTFPSLFTGLRGKGTNIWNLSAVKNFQVTERAKLQFRCEWLNTFNHTHFGKPNMTPTNTNFGRITATSGFPRQIYFALKLLF